MRIGELSSTARVQPSLASKACLANCLPVVRSYSPAQSINQRLPNTNKNARTWLPEVRAERSLLDAKETGATFATPAILNEV